MKNPNTFTIYNASAGSGKTYTLVKEYLLLLLRSGRKDTYKNILAITFTNKAVAEMKSRIISTLNALAAKKCPPDTIDLLKDLAVETGIPENEIQKKAEIILKSILHNYAAFDISTIDRFTHKILRSFAKDLGIPVNFEVELNTRLVLKEAVDRLINRAGEDKKLTKALLSYTLTKTDDDKSWDISKDLFDFSLLLTQESHQKYVRFLKNKSLQDFADFSQKLTQNIRETESEIAKTADSFFEMTESESITKSHFNGGYLFKYFAKLKATNYNCAFGAKWQDEIDDKPLYSKAVPGLIKDVLDKQHEKISGLFKNSKAEVCRREYLKEIIKNLTPLSLLSEIASEIENIKKERSLILISDFNPIIEAEIYNQPAPFIYERLGERYRNYFIDEFQDTSEMQWQNMVPLIDHALSTEHPDNDIAGLTLVGDAKQSIYRFRGGKAEQFISLYNEENPFTTEKKITNLPDNYRSAEKIVEFNNSFFQFVSGKFKNGSYQDLFKSSGQNTIRKFSGYVNISFLESENAQEDMEVHPQKALDIIRDLDEQKVSRSDICILTRTRKQSFAIATYLNDRGISIISSESLLVSNSPEVHFINSVLEFSVNSKDKNLKWDILNYLVRKIPVENSHLTIQKNLLKDDNSFFHWLKVHDIHFDLRQLEILSLYEAAEYIIRCFGLTKTPDAYLQFYLDFIFEKTSNNFFGITAFLELWNQEKDRLSIVAPKTEDAVQIMTIHKSKGLEFPIVIYPFANSLLRDLKRDYLWLPLPENLNDIPVGYLKASKKMLDWGDLEAFAYQERLDQTEFDNINVLYVAFTRASRQLYILSNYDLKKGQEIEDKVSGLLIGYLKSQHLWNENFTYEFGNKTLTDYIKKVSPTTIRQKEYISTPTRNDVVKIITTPGSLWDSGQETAINKGVLVHNILSEIDTSEDIPVAVEKFSKAENISQVYKSELEQTVKTIISNPALSAFFAAGLAIERERDIICPSGEILRPDRLNFSGNNVTIIDYKTGNARPSHQTQMEKYSGVLAQMGFEVHQKILVYINNEVNIVIV